MQLIKTLSLMAKFFIVKGLTQDLSSKNQEYLRAEQSLAHHPIWVQNCFRIDDPVVFEYMLSRLEHNSKHGTTVNEQYAASGRHCNAERQ